MNIKIKCFINHIVIFFACVCSIFPYLLIIVSSFNTSVNIRKGAIFTHISIQNWKNNLNTLFKNPVFVNSLKNTFIVSIATVVIGVFLASLAGYAFVVYRNKFMNKLFVFSLFLIMIPTSVLVIPLFIILRNFNMLDSLFSIILVSLSLPFLIYLFRQNTKLFPFELIKAARIDGLNEFTIYYKVYLPNLKAVFITASLITFINTWNGLLYPLVIIQSQKNMTLPIYINSIGTSYTSDYGAFMISLLISTIPILFVFILAQKHFKVGMKTM